MGNDIDAVRRAVDRTIAAGSAHYTIEIVVAEPAGVRSTTIGVAGFRDRRAATLTCFDGLSGVPESSTEVYAVVIGNTMYAQVPGGQGWVGVDVDVPSGGWVALSPIGVLGWLYGVTEVQRLGEGGRYAARASAQLAVRRAPSELRDQVRGSFREGGLLEADVELTVEPDPAGRVRLLAIRLPAARPPGENEDNAAADVRLELFDFGVPVSIQPPDAGSPVSMREYLGRCRAAAGPAGRPYDPGTGPTLSGR